MQVQNNDISRESSCTISYAVIVTKNFLKGPFYRYGSNASWLQSHYKETILLIYCTFALVTGFVSNMIVK